MKFIFPLPLLFDALTLTPSLPHHCLPFSPPLSLSSLSSNLTNCLGHWLWMADDIICTSPNLMWEGFTISFSFVWLANGFCLRSISCDAWCGCLLCYIVRLFVWFSVRRIHLRFCFCFFFFRSLIVFFISSLPPKSARWQQWTVSVLHGFSSHGKIFLVINAKQTKNKSPSKIQWLFICVKCEYHDLIDHFLSADAIFSPSLVCVVFIYRFFDFFFCSFFFYLDKVISFIDKWFRNWSLFIVCHEIVWRSFCCHIIR